MNSLDRPTRRCFQFRLQTLAGAFVVLGLVFAVLAALYDRARRQRDAVRAVRESGGEVYDEAFAEQDSFFDTHFFGDPSGPGWLTTLMGDDAVSSVGGVVYPPSATSPKLAPVLRLPGVRWLSLMGAKVGDSEVAELEGAAGLELLNLSATEITDQALPALARLRGLRRLSLDFTSVGDDGLSHLEQLDRLDELHLIETKVTAAGVERFHRVLPDVAIRWSHAPTDEHRLAAAAITRLGGDYYDVADWRARGPARLTGVAEFGVGRNVMLVQSYGWQGSDADIAQLNRIVGLKSVCLAFFLRLSPVGIEHLRALHDVEELSLRNSSITDADLIALTKPKGGLRHLKALNLQATKVTDAGLDYLGNLGELESLNLKGIFITGSGLDHLKGNTNLRELDLTDDNLTDVGWAQLAELQSLRKLCLYSTNITDDGLIHVKQLSRLEELNLLNTKITNAGLGHLTALKQLRELQLYQTQVTDAGVAELQKALPQCDILH